MVEKDNMGATAPQSLVVSSLNAQELSVRVRRSVVASMAITDERGYSHDDYDNAHAALSELVRRAEERDEAAHQLKNYKGNMTVAWEAAVEAGRAAEARVDTLTAALKEAIDVAIWMSGSADFGPDGEAGEAWPVKRDRLYAALALLQGTAEQSPPKK